MRYELGGPLGLAAMNGAIGVPGRVRARRHPWAQGVIEGLDVAAPLIWSRTRTVKTVRNRRYSVRHLLALLSRGP
jgi:hypothetical protein